MDLIFEIIKAEPLFIIVLIFAIIAILWKIYTSFVGIRNFFKVINGSTARPSLQQNATGVDELSLLMHNLEDMLHQDAHFYGADKQFKELFLLLSQQNQGTQTDGSIQSKEEVSALLNQIMIASKNRALNYRPSPRYEANMGKIYSAAAQCGIDPRSIGRGY